MTQDAIYEPLRKCQQSKYFKKQNGRYVICTQFEQGAMPMTINDIPDEETKLLLPPDVSINDYLLALSKIKPTVSEEDLVKQQEFTAEFGQEG